MTPPSIRDLLIAIRRAANADPLLFNKFIEEFEKYADWQVINVLQANNQEILQAQGSARGIQHVLRLLQHGQTYDPSTPAPPPNLIP